MADEFVRIRRAGGPTLHLGSDAHGGFEIPAGPCELLVPAWVLPLVPDAEIVTEPAAPAEE